MKHLLDRIISFFGLLFLSPIFAIVAILIKLRMPDGPVIFKQDRVGKNGKIFKIYKFRTMEMDHGGSSVSVRGYSHITSLGRKLRRFKLDELPQLWNILKGDMSLVGPRPDVPGYADALVGEDREMLLLRPGVTGPASLKYRDEEELLAKVNKELSEGKEILDGKGLPVRTVLEYNDRVIFPDKVRLNRYYLHHQSIWLDLKLIVATVLRLHLHYDGEVI